MRHFHSATADVQWRTGKFLNAEGVESDAGANNVNDGVHGADFVKVNLFERHIVDMGFGFAELDENFRGAVAYFRSELRFLQDVEDRAERAVLLLIFGLDLNAGGGHAVLPDFIGVKFPARDLQAAKSGAEVFQVAAGVNQSAKRHVAANARKTIKIGEFHGMPRAGGIAA